MHSEVSYGEKLVPLEILSELHTAAYTLSLDCKSDIPCFQRTVHGNLPFLYAVLVGRSERLERLAP